jgi:hypothetical protein
MTPFCGCALPADPGSAAAVARKRHPGVAVVAGVGVCEPQVQARAASAPDASEAQGREHRVRKAKVGEHQARPVCCPRMG